MLNKSVARRYAEAYFSIAQEQGRIDQFQLELGNVVQSLETVDNLKEYFAHLLIPAKDKKEIATKLFAEHVSPITLNFLLMIIDKKRETYLELIYKEYLDMADISRNIQKAELVSAREVPDEELESLANKLSKSTGKQIQLSQRIDPGLLGGVKIRIGDKIIDGTVIKKLEMLKDDLRKAKIS